MNNTALLRTLITYAICVPVAIIIGYVATMTVYVQSGSNFRIVGFLALALSLPIFLRWHYPLMVFCWNVPMTLFFLPGGPSTYLPFMALSLGISLLQRSLNREKHFIRVPQLTWPLLAMVAVVLITAKFTGGIGLHALGSEVMGGKKYVFLLGGIASYFALTARRIPPERAQFYVTLFFLGGCLSFLSDVVVHLPVSYFDLFFPPDSYSITVSGARFTGVGTAGLWLFTLMLARYGIREIFLARKTWRAVVLVLAFAAIFFGGFRSFVGLAVMVFLIQFFLEGMHRTKLMPALIFVCILGAVTCLLFSDKLPTSVQRTISFLPVKIDTATRIDAESSMDWRFQMWEALLPQVPHYLLLGKGFAITQEDFEFMGTMVFKAVDPADQALALSGDYHNGPLSVIIPLGIWGALAWLWILSAGLWALRRNYRYGDPALRIINVSLFALFITKVIFFFFVFGAVTNDMVQFAGLLGLSVSINGGIARRPAKGPAGEPVKPAAPHFPRPRLQPVFPRQ